MKKLKAISMGCLCAVAAAASAQGYQSTGIQATVNGQPVYFRDVQPMMINGRIMVPLRGVFEQMGAYVTWHPETRMVIAQSATTEIRLPVGSTSAWVGGNSVTLDSPAIMRSGRTLVPLRFMAESLNANVDWIAESRTVAISTTGTSAARNTTPITEPGRDPGYVDPRPVRNNPPARRARAAITIPSNTVIPFKLDTRLSSQNAREGDRFTATLSPTNDMNEYEGLPLGTKVQGHVSAAVARDGNTPGALGLEFDRVILPNGRTYNLDGALIGLDSKSVEESNGRLVAKNEAKNDNLKYVGYGAGAGVLLSVLGKGDLLKNALIGGALGFIFGEIEKSQRKPADVVLEPGSRFGVRLTDDLQFRMNGS